MCVSFYWRYLFVPNGNTHTFHYISTIISTCSHNLRLLHSGEVRGDGNAYSDHTGFMSSAITGVHDTLNFPKQCYNAQNHWNLDWYKAELMQTVNPTTQPTLVKIVAFADVATAEASADRVLVRTGENLDLYMQYNRAKGFNADTYEYQDKLVIVSDNGSGTTIEADLDLANESFYSRQESGNSKPLRVEVCSQEYFTSTNTPDYLMVYIGYSTTTMCDTNEQPAAADTNEKPAAATTATTWRPFQALSTSFTGLSGFNLKEVCLKKGKECFVNEDCCTDTCHNDKCGGASKVKDTDSDYIIGGTGRVRGGVSRGLRGL
jgi:hypothetical protein